MAKKQKVHPLDMNELLGVARILDESEPEAMAGIATVITKQGYRQAMYYAELATAMYDEMILTVADGSRERTLGGHFFLICEGPGKANYMVQKFYGDKWRARPLKDWSIGDGPQLKELK